MLQDSLTHRVRLILRERTAGRAAAKAWLQAGVQTLSAVREFWPSARISFSEQRALSRRVGDVALQGMGDAVASVQRDMILLMEREQAWAMRLLDQDIPNEVWEFVGGPWPAGSRTQEELVVPIDDKVAAEVLNTPLAGMQWQERFELLGAEQRARLRRTIASGIAEAAGIPEITRQIKNDMIWGSKRAAMIARTEVHHVSSEIHRRVYEANKKVLNGKQFVATLDERTCMECGGLDGSSYFYEPTQGEASIDDAPAIPIHANCRCVYVAITKWAEMIGLSEPTRGTRASMNGQVPATQTFKQWLRQQPAKRQDVVLGSHVRGLAWRKGGQKGLPKFGRPPSPGR